MPEIFSPLLGPAFRGACYDFIADGRVDLQIPAGESHGYLLPKSNFPLYSQKIKVILSSLDSICWKSKGWFILL
jgi:hypothetical protein